MAVCMFFHRRAKHFPRDGRLNRKFDKTYVRPIILLYLGPLLILNEPAVEYDYSFVTVASSHLPPVFFGIYQAMFAGRAWAASQLIEQKISIAK